MGIRTGQAANDDSWLERSISLSLHIMTEKELMLSGLPYSAEDMRLLKELNATKDVIHRYNALVPSQEEEKKAILKELLGHIADDQICINQPFYCDYGKQISVGKRFFANFNFTVLDEAPVTIGDNVWIGGSVTILPGVTIGSTTTIGAGSVVTKDIPDNVVAAGNPCRVIRKLKANED